MKIEIVGTGYVGLSSEILDSRHYEVVAPDIIPEKVEMLNRRISPIDYKEIQNYLQVKVLNFRAILDKHKAYVGVDFVIISTPADYDEATNYFNTKSIECATADVLNTDLDATMAIKSTIPASYTKMIKEGEVC